MEKNELYPVFLKVASLRVLIVGGGNVGLEKLTFLLKSSPSARVTMVSMDYIPEVIALAEGYEVELIRSPYNKSYLKDKQIAIATTDDLEVNLQVHKDCKDANILVNLADNPKYCDFYMGGIVTKGNVKIAISTNGKSPTAAKRLRQFFEEILPENMNELVENLNTYRKTIKGDFEDKVTKLNELTKEMIKMKKD
ncbi:precorrin-2 dehydrogenase/sirohydrochlorin ferrochelatase family protein [Lutimonas zeaxanthinifaciens]|uniref:precorrin-2 dehydrogenase/sirohydrochlorin ferrochelatase family protein n=1 Tax=Lutimonas zeaxanthinifaciens TaxID=3060215 RepID=UPI00265D4DE8|nr:bifunctional precorrin-2 dehydrogenase/sirohydrochlorin ferrochelatase [Lutimonas sp. YSD2104]WKK65214.1 bifunctional precorrin-2 dehydrogenase/sirohydrochlorin ferrochelatase [Lutimonas sp. YSD2104]